MKATSYRVRHSCTKGSTASVIDVVEEPFEPDLPSVVCSGEDPVENPEEHPVVNPDEHPVVNPLEDHVPE